MEIAPGLPFAPEEKLSPPGCSRPLLIGCGVILVLIAIASLAFVVKGPDVVSWLFERLEADVTARIPEEVEPVDRRRLEIAFESFRGALRSGAIDPGGLQEVQKQMLVIGRKPPGEISAADVTSLTDALEAAVTSPTQTDPSASPQPASP